MNGPISFRPNSTSIRWSISRRHGRCWRRRWRRAETFNSFSSVVARISAATCGVFPGYRYAHPGYEAEIPQPRHCWHYNASAAGPVHFHVEKVELAISGAEIVAAQIFLEPDIERAEPRRVLDRLHGAADMILRMV